MAERMSSKGKKGIASAEKTQSQAAKEAGNESQGGNASESHDQERDPENNRDVEQAGGQSLEPKH